MLVLEIGAKLPAGDGVPDASREVLTRCRHPAAIGTESSPKDAIAVL
jgi:hypothetical protein